ncbi:MAG TPA: hypothetical protein VHE30_10655 [Polyangiaceae bacterium]|nr:hypothetical protein [Polyangiaceae bacterium]
MISFGTESDARPPDRAGGYSVALEDEDGAPLRTFRRNGTTFVLGYEGDRYEIRLDNDTDRRVEAVVTVDGRDAISGELGDYTRRGYIVPAHGTIRVDGFRRSLDRTAAFRFSAPSSSYSARMGTPENVGVIGVAFFPERRIVRRPPPRWWSWEDAKRDEAGDLPHRRERSDRSGDLGTSWGEKRPAPPAPAASGGGAGRASAGAQASESRRAPARKSADGSYGYDDGREENRLGTEYGESTYSPVTEVSFVRENSSVPSVVLSVRYDDEQGLEARGIDVFPRPYWPERERGPGDFSSPDPFPQHRFAPPPP